MGTEKSQFVVNSINDSQSTWLTPPRAVQHLGLESLKALYQAVRRGDIPAHRLGKRRLRFNRKELDDLLLRR